MTSSSSSTLGSVASARASSSRFRPASVSAPGSSRRDRRGRRSRASPPPARRGGSSPRRPACRAATATFSTTRQVGERADDLVRPHHAAAGEAVRGQPADLLLPQAHLARGRPGPSPREAEAGRLAGAVRPDDAQDLALAGAGASTASTALRPPKLFESRASRAAGPSCDGRLGGRLLPAPEAAQDRGSRARRARAARRG